MKKNIDIDLGIMGEVTATVIFTYNRGCHATQYQPAEAESVEIEQVFVNGLDIIEALNEKAVESIEQQILDALEDERE